MRTACPTSGRDLHRRTEGQFFYSHPLAASILKPSSAPMGVIQDMRLDDTHKGREAFSEIHLQDPA
jgi:hypothetical protein